MGKKILWMWFQFRFFIWFFTFFYLVLLFESHRNFHTISVGDCKNVFVNINTAVLKQYLRQKKKNGNKNRKSCCVYCVYERVKVDSTRKTLPMLNCEFMNKVWYFFYSLLCSCRQKLQRIDNKRHCVSICVFSYLFTLGYCACECATNHRQPPASSLPLPRPLNRMENIENAKSNVNDGYILLYSIIVWVVCLMWWEKCECLTFALCHIKWTQSSMSCEPIDLERERAREN